MIDKINEIVQDLANTDKQLDDVLLKVQVLAHQLKNQKLKDWVRNEVNGYDASSIVPPYRIVSSPVFGDLEQHRGFGQLASRPNIKLET